MFKWLRKIFPTGEQLFRLEEQNLELRKALYDIAERHRASPLMGNCACTAHIRADELLKIEPVNV